MSDEVLVVDDPGDYEDPKTEALFDEAFAFGRNYADNDETRMRALHMVEACLGQAEEQWSSRYSKMVKLGKLWHQQSLSHAAEDYQVHMGTPFQKTEELAGKLSGAMFGGGQEYVGGEVEYEDDEEKANLTVSLVQEVMETEMEVSQSSLSDLRDTGIYGVKVKKILPEKLIDYRLEPQVESVEMPDGATAYRFKKPEETERWTTRVRALDVSVFDFRCPPTAKNIKDADWCGDYSYPGWDEVQDRIRRGEFSKAAVDQGWDDYVRSSQDDGNSHPGTASTLRGSGTSVSAGGRTGYGQGAVPDQSPTSTQFSCFEYWGPFDIEGNGRRKPCVVTILYPSEDLTRAAPRGSRQGWVVRIARNPYVHQDLPYAAIKLFEKDNEFYTPGVMEIVGKHSAYEDEFGTLALQQGMLEVTPPLEVADGADVTDEELDGWMAGKPLRVDEPGRINYLRVPPASGRGIQTLEYFSSKAVEVAGLGIPNNAPRTSAAGIVTEAQEYDQRLASYIIPIEQGYLVRAARLVHAYVRQFFTAERKVKVLGIEGGRARDFRTIRPTDVVAEMRFEPIVGRRMVQKAFQGQQMINWWDRAAAANMQLQAQGRGELFNMEEQARFIYREVFGVRDTSKFLNALADPMQIRTPSEEHKMFHMGELPGVQSGEKLMIHFNEHLDFWEAGGTESWQPERRQAFFDHIQKTGNMLMRQMMGAMPDAGDMIAQQLQARMEGLGMTPTGPNMLGGVQEGGRGIDAGGAVGSPMLRRPGIPGVQAETMGMTANMGAQ